VIVGGTWTVFTRRRRNVKVGSDNYKEMNLENECTCIYVVIFIGIETNVVL